MSALPGAAAGGAGAAGAAGGEAGGAGGAGGAAGGGATAWVLCTAVIAGAVVAFGVLSGGGT